VRDAGDPTAARERTELCWRKRGPAADLRADAHGEAVQHVDYSLISVSPAQTRDFQFIYRDAAGGGSGFNLSNGLRVVFCP
jgi:hypothetical protein